MIKRIMFFMLVNIAVVATVGIILNLLGINHYLSANGIDYTALLIFCLVWGMVGSFISLQLSKWMAKKMMGVEILDPKGPHASLVNKVHNMAQRAGIEVMPEVGVYNSPEVNAFATGPRKNNSLVAVSTGLLSRMNDDEVEGVLAHEIAHVANGDMVTMALVQGVVNAFVMFLSRVAAFAVSQALRGNNDRDSGPNPLVHMLCVFVFDLLFAFLAMPIVAWFSRYREYRADAGGAALAGREKMIAALERLKNNVDRIADSDQQFQSMKISGKIKFSELFSTHPPLDKRIAALRGGRPSH